MDPWAEAENGTAAALCDGLAVADAFFTEGLLRGTRIATEAGWTAVEEVGPGIRVLTFDAGPCALREMHRVTPDLSPGNWPQAHWPVRLPVGALGNRQGLDLLPGQSVLIESDCAEAMFGDPFALVPARALDGWRGIEAVRPERGAEVLVPVFDEDQVIYAEGGTLLFCPGLRGQQIAQDDGSAATGYAPLSLRAARDLIARIMAADTGAAPDGAAPFGYHAALVWLAP